MDYITISILILNTIQLIPDAINTITNLRNFRSECCGSNVSWDDKKSHRRHSDPDIKLPKTN